MDYEHFQGLFNDSSKIQVTLDSGSSLDSRYLRRK